MDTARGARAGALLTILGIALALRLHNIGFGLPSLYDPDEPIFMVMGLKLLREGTLNPGWFGHPGTTTIYLVALIEAAVLAVGRASGHFASVADFARAAYADPAILVVPARVSMALFGAGCVWLTYVLGRRAFGTTAALIGAAFLALNALHIQWSQVVRTDVMASFFMLASLVFAVAAASSGRARDYCLSGLFVGIAIATKWPSAIVALGLIGAAMFRVSQAGSGWRDELRRLAAALVCVLVALFISSPYIFLDWQSVLSDVSGEVNHGHLAQNGGGFIHNLGWYLAGQAAPTMGVGGLILAAAGAILAFRRSAAAAWPIVPALAGFLALICSQSMVWSRWLVPALPLLCLLAGVAVDRLGRLAGSWLNGRRSAATALLAALAAIPMLASATAGMRERETDTRSLAADWAAANIPRGSRVLLEHLEFKLRGQPWHFLFPMGDAGCVDALDALASRPGYEELSKVRNGSPIVDIGNVSPRKLDSCNADFVILTYFDLYIAEAGKFPREVANYRSVLAGGRTVALFRPVPGNAGGPIVRIVAVKRQSIGFRSEISQLRR